MLHANNTIYEINHAKLNATFLLAAQETVSEILGTSSECEVKLF